MKMLTVIELEKLNTKRLKAVFNSARAIYSAEWRRFAIQKGFLYPKDEDGWIGDSDDAILCRSHVAHLQRYKDRIKKILDTRENV